MAADTFQIKRGATAQVAAYLPAAGELVLDTTLTKLHVGDGTTVGGTAVGSPTSSFMTTVLDDVSAAAARSTLGAAASGANTDITSITGSAASLTTTRSISLTGDGAWTVNFNGTADATAALTLATTGITAGTYNSLTVDAKGRATAGTLVAAFANLTLQNSWAVMAGYRCASRRVGDSVQIEFGGVNGTATDGTTLATLPVGSRPPFAISMPVSSAPNTALSTTVPVPRVTIGTDGTIKCANCSSVSGIFFVATISIV